MASYIDFKQIKERISFPQAIQILGVQMRLRGNQYRSECPTCKHGGDRALVITDQKGFYCHAAQKGGDVIAFAAHVRDEGQREAAEFLAQYAGIDSTPTSSPAPQREKTAKTTGNSGELRPLDYLTTDHPAIELLGLTEEVCAIIGIGFANKGTMNGRVVFPLRLESGSLIGYIGVATKPDQAPLLKIPSNLGELCGVGGTVEEAEQEPPKSKDELRKLFRVV
jgi:DNA primase